MAAAATTAGVHCAALEAELLAVKIDQANGEQKQRIDRRREHLIAEDSAQIQRFEEGAALAKLCQDRLSEAEVKVRKLEESLEGVLSTQPLSEDSLGAA